MRDECVASHPVPEKMPEAVPENVQNRRSHARQAIFKRAHFFPIEEEAGLAIHDISHHGLMGESAARLVRLQRVHVSFDSHRYIEAQVRWIAGERFGLACASPLFLPPGVSLREEPAEDGLAPRERRLSIDIEACLTISRPVLAGLVRNISLGGAQIETQHHLTEGSALLFQLPGRPALRSRVQWAKGKSAGLEFSALAPVEIITLAGDVII